MSNLNMQKLQTLKGPLKKFLMESRPEKSISDKISPLVNGLQYSGEVMERFQERNVLDPMILALTCLDTLAEPNMQAWDNQREEFYSKLEKSKLLDTHFLNVVAMMMYNTMHKEKKDILPTYKLLTEEERIFLLETIIFSNESKADRTVSFVRYKMGLESFSNFESYILELEDGSLEKLYLTTLLVFSTKEFKKVDNLLKGKKELHDLKDDVIEELKTTLHLKKEEIYFVGFLTQSLFGDLSKVKTFRLSYHLFKFNNLKIIKNIFYLNKKFDIKLNMNHATKSSEFLRNLFQKDKNEVTKNTLYFIFMDYLNSTISYMDDLNEFKDLLSVNKFKIFKENDILDGLCKFYSMIMNNHVKQKIFYAESSKLTTVELRNLKEVVLESYIERNQLDIDVFHLLYKRKILSLEDIVLFKLKLKDENIQNFKRETAKQLMYKDYMYEIAEMLIGSEFKEYLTESILYNNYGSLLYLKNKEIVEKNIKDLISYIEVNNLSCLESLLIFIYKNKNTVSKDLYKKVEDTIVYLHEKGNIESTIKYEEINNLFDVQVNTVQDFIRTHTDFYSYSSIHKHKRDTIDIVLKPFKMTKNQEIINKLADVILDIPFGYRKEDTSQDFFYFIQQILSLELMTKAQKMKISMAYLEAIFNDNKLLKRKNKDEIVFVTELLFNKKMEV